MISSWKIWGFVLVSFLGFLDATYLTIEHYRNVIPPCSIDGCETVLTSSYATFGSFPIAALGAAYYLVIFLLSVFYLDTHSLASIRFAAWFSIIGLLASAWLLYLQLFVINALCLYCIGSATTSVVLFILGIFVLTQKRVTEGRLLQ